MIKATFPAGVEALTVHGLAQWDYGQKLEITHPDLPAVLEVHFAAVGAQNAIVRPVSSAAGVAEAPIPDGLLEQSRPILAWVYLVGETSGETMLTVTMPLKARAKPGAAGPVPAPVADKYTEAVAAMNDAVASVLEGGLTVAKALEADKANTANTAAKSDKATTADSATKASQDGDGNVLPDTYVKKARNDWTRYTAAAITFQPNPNYVTQFRVVICGKEFYAVATYSLAAPTYAALGAGYIAINGNEAHNLNLTLEIGADGKLSVIGLGPNTGGLLAIEPSAIYYRRI